MIEVQLLKPEGLTPEIVAELGQGIMSISQPIFLFDATLEDAFGLLLAEGSISVLLKHDGKVVGVAYAYAIEQGHSATVHFVMWEKQLWWATEMRETLKSVQEWFVKKFSLKRLTIYAPRSFKSANGLAKLLGFQLEGVLRMGARVGPLTDDMMVYGKLFGVPSAHNGKKGMKG